MHSSDMRTHSDIVSKAGAERLADLRGVSVHTVRSWATRDSIPAEHWLALVSEKLATLDELAAHAAANPRRSPDQSAAA